MRYYFGGNYFLNCKGLEGAIYKYRSDFYKEIRLETEYNYYSANGAFYGTILSVHKYINENVPDKEIGIVVMKNEIVTKNFYAREI